MAVNVDALGGDQLLELWRVTRDHSIRDLLVTEYIPLVIRLCERFQHLGEPIDDLIRVGTIGLIKAIDNYDAQRSNKLAGFAIPMVVREIENFFRDHGWAVKLPQKLQLNRLLVDRTVEGLIQRLGRSPTIPEIGRAAVLSNDEVYEALEVERYDKPLSMDAYHDRDDGPKPATVLDYLGEQAPDLEGLADRIDLEDAIIGVDPREQVSLHLKFYSGLSQSAVA